jgi:hypothetical protein
MKIPGTAIVAVVEMCMGVPKIHEPARSATKYLAPNLIVRATRVLSPKKYPYRCNQNVVLTIGRPNYLETEFVKKCQKVGVKFPIQKVQAKWYSKKKGKK